MNVTGLPAVLLEEVRKLFAYINPDFVKANRFGHAAKMQRVISTLRNERGIGGVSIPRGELPKLLELLEERGVAYRVTDARAQGKPWVFSSLTRKGKPFEPYDFQAEIAAVLEERENVLVRSPTGSGKTYAALLAVARVGRYALFVVPTAELAKQTREVVVDCFGETWARDHLGMIGGGKFSVGPITIGLPISLASRMAELEDLFGTLVYDEVQRAAAPSFFDVVDKSPARFRLGVSADERRKDGKGFLVHAVFGKVAFEVDREELIDRDVVLDVEVRMVPTSFTAPWFVERIEKARELADRVKEGEKVDKKTARAVSKETLEAFGKLIEEMSLDRDRNALASKLLIGATMEGHRSLAFLHRREHAEVLRADVAMSEPRVGLMLGGKEDAAEFTRCRRGLESGDVRVGIGTFQAMGVGIDLPAVSRGVVVTPTHTNRPFFGQVRGRLCRRSDTPAVLYYLWDRDVFGLRPLEAMVRWNRTTNVLHGGEWVNGRALLKELRAAEGR